MSILLHRPKSCTAALFLFFWLTMLAGLSSKAQLPHELRTYGGDVFTGKRLIYVSPILKPSQFELDERAFESAEVAFFRNNHGYFANLSRIYSDRAERYAIRIREGKINLFEEIEMEAYGQDALDIPETGDNEMLASGETFQYFSLQDGPVQKASYANLRKALEGNEESAREIRIYRNYRWLQIGLIAGGAGIIAWELVRQDNEVNSSPDAAVRFTPMIALGIVMGGSSYFLQGAKENAKWLAVDAYNK
ncbi:MAG: hypothetical protein ACK505_07145 [Flavobacteriales bacterium]